MKTTKSIRIETDLDAKVLKLAESNKEDYSEAICNLVRFALDLQMGLPFLKKKLDTTRIQFMDASLEYSKFQAMEEATRKMHELAKEKEASRIKEEMKLSREQKERAKSIQQLTMEIQGIDDPKEQLTFIEKKLKVEKSLAVRMFLSQHQTILKGSILDPDYVLKQMGVKK